MKLFFKISYIKIQHLLFIFNIKFTNKTILILDIDNTIADTWPTLNQKYQSELERVKSLKPLKGTIDYLKLNYATDAYKWVYLSRRNYNIQFTTINWLRNIGLSANIFNVIFVQKPSEKIYLIEKHIRRPFVYFDDMSYNHENDEIKFYLDEISAIKSNEFAKYYSYSDILNLNKNA